MVEMVDSHTHVSLLPYEGLENMALTGVKKLLAVPYFLELSMRRHFLIIFTRC
ncbi:putative metal-dependent TIM-barrel fold hydrolase [Carboxydothermus ferrireducens DSM 11255]|uniref:Metal-dependent TIM-barrel fold hydrolase n=1 Tax=Carboxydothermus ferrireducens DSM 11255 TaxID=1119529 RepID=A0ABX2RDV6_9THEO|nr:putative metal-dependent TIM-barrel fold hydrolase [Carboxydothermus ferrireducens DSM 11255]